MTPGGSLLVRRDVILSDSRNWELPRNIVRRYTPGETEEYVIFATGLNDQGEVVGFAFPSDFDYRGMRGRMRNSPETNRGAPPPELPETGYPFLRADRTYLNLNLCIPEDSPWEAPLAQRCQQPKPSHRLRPKRGNPHRLPAGTDRGQGWMRKKVTLALLILALLFTLLHLRKSWFARYEVIELPVIEGYTFSSGSMINNKGICHSVGYCSRPNPEGRWTIRDDTEGNRGQMGTKLGTDRNCHRISAFSSLSTT